MISKTSPLSTLTGRICCLAAGPNLLYFGTVSGEIQVASKSSGALLPNRTWLQPNTPIEGIMFDYEGKVIYGTEFNLVILDKAFGNKLKEVRSYNPLRKNLGDF
jgi:hypothetical protein